MLRRRSEVKQHRLLFRNSLGTPVGRLTLGGRIDGGTGVEPRRPMRTYGSFAFTFVIRGRGSYEDAYGRRESLGAGDLVLVFPEIAHTYGPPAGETWDELYFVFGGPTFETWRTHGVLNPSRPVVHTGDACLWKSRLMALAERPRPLSPGAALEELQAFLGIFAGMLALDAPQKCGEPIPWLSSALALLEAELHEDMSGEDVASRLGLGYESFRKRFVEATGIPPMRHRCQKRVAAAGELLLYTRLTCAQIAERT
ncbi:AraC family transcriptional regulator, partial [bacterium]